MKKYLNISFSILLLIATTGVSVSSHVCGGAIHDTALFKDAEKCHGEHHGDMSGCCDDQTEYHQVEDDFQPSDKLSANYFPQIAFVIPELFLIRNENITRPLNLLHINSPPPAFTGKFIVVNAQAFLL